MPTVAQQICTKFGIHSIQNWKKSFHPPSRPLRCITKIKRFLKLKNLEVFQVERGQKDSSSISVWSIYGHEGLQHNLQIPIHICASGTRCATRSCQTCRIQCQETSQLMPGGGPTFLKSFGAWYDSVVSPHYGSPSARLQNFWTNDWSHKCVEIWKPSMDGNIFVT